MTPSLSFFICLNIITITSAIDFLRVEGLRFEDVDDAILAMISSILALNAIFTIIFALLFGFELQVFRVTATSIELTIQISKDCSTTHNAYSQQE